MTPEPQLARCFTIAPAHGDERPLIYHLRHEIYARELHQHAENPEARLTDSLDGVNEYLLARHAGSIAGFMGAITPPNSVGYSIDKYLRRSELPFAPDDQLYEARLLTVLPEYRHSEAAMLLMYAALRWIEERGGNRIVAIGRLEFLDLYLRLGFRDCVVGLLAIEGPSREEETHSRPNLA